MKKLGIKLLVLVLALSMALGLGGCGTKSEPTPEPAATETPAVETDVVADAVNAYYANMPEDIYKMNQKKFVEMAKANDESIYVLDIRQADDYEKGHVKGAVNLPWGKAISDNLDKLPADKTIMVYCYSGQTAGQTVALLNMAGFEAKSVNLGWNFGISKVEGVADITETTVNDFPEVKAVEINPEIKGKLVEYFEGLAAVKDTTFKNYKISEDNAKKFLDAKDDSVVFLSIRSKEDYDKGHIEGAVLIPWGKGMEKEFANLPKDKKIIVYCYTGQTAGQTVAGLKMLGYDAVSLNGGMGMEPNKPIGWANKGYPVVSSVVEEAVNGYFANMPEDIYKMNQKKFVEMVKANDESIYVLDIRNADDYKKGHVKGAVNLPWGSPIGENLDKLPADKTIMVYCYSGQTAGQTVALLNMAGFEAKSVNLGWNFGVSKVEGVDAITETKANDFPAVKALEIDPTIKEKLVAYFNGLADVKETTYKNYKISEDNAKKFLDDKDDSVVFLSIRSKEDYDKGHIEGAMLIPWGKGMEKEFGKLPMDKKVIVYCYTGQTAGQTVAGLKMLGYDAVSLNGGMGMEPNKPIGWANKGYPVVK